jgi:RNA polymerase sigma factor (sigma-70 family)
MKRPDEFIPTRHSLLYRLKDWDDQESWKMFFETYWKLIYNAAIKAGLTDAEAQDVVQETVVSVMKSMAEFNYDAKKGSFKAWLLRLTNWRIVDQFRKRQRANSGQESEAGVAPASAELENVMDPSQSILEAAWDEEWEKNLMDAALEKVKAKVDSKQYQIFDLYFVQKWPVFKIAKVLSVNSGKVYLAKHRVGKILKREIEGLRNKPI